MKDYIKSLGNEEVRVDNFVRFSSIYNTVHTLVRGGDAFAIKVRRAYNRLQKAALVDDRSHISTAALAINIADELDPTWR